MFYYKDIKKIFIKPGIKKYQLIALLRVRNEDLILLDTLDHLSQFCDGIVAYDDASTDATYKILCEHPHVLAVVKNKKWAHTIEDRLKAETEHRRAIMNLALLYHPEWLFCADADERYIGDIRSFICSEESKNTDGVRISLFDAYITENDKIPYTGGKLKDFRKFFGIERRDILMLFRSNANPAYEGLDRREPILHSNRIATLFYAQHYGKSISIQQWEETCNYYVNHFPYEPYGKKWEERRGKAVHAGLSDFNTPLYPWGEELFQNAVCIHP